jgi:hypothetical protein
VLSATDWERRIRTPTLEPLERRMDSCQGRTEMAKPCPVRSRAQLLFRRPLLYPLVDKLRTLTELDPETVVVLSL